MVGKWKKLLGKIRSLYNKFGIVRFLLLELLIIFILFICFYILVKLFSSFRENLPINMNNTLKLIENSSNVIVGFFAFVLFISLAIFVIILLTIALVSIIDCLSNSKSTERAEGNNKKKIDSDNKLFPITYFYSLIQFILYCDKPYTISLEGEWGSGKTTLMEYIQNNDTIKEHYICSYFNVWKYAQFNMSDRLPNIILSKLYENLVPTDKFDKDFLNTLLNFGYKYASYKLVQKTDGLDKIFNIDTISQIDKMEEKFNNAIEKMNKESNKSGLIIFIDNLDRVEPEKAVEILESLHVYFNSKGCIFILAVDFDVVKKGVQKKYGFDEKKSKNYFDKIIQLSYKMPQEYYLINDYFNEVFDNNVYDRFEKEFSYEVCNKYVNKKLKKELDKELFDTIKNKVKELLSKNNQNKNNIEDTISITIKNNKVVDNKKISLRDGLLYTFQHTIGNNPRLIKKTVSEAYIYLLADLFSFYEKRTNDNENDQDKTSYEKRTNENDQDKTSSQYCDSIVLFYLFLHCVRESCFPLYKYIIQCLQEYEYKYTNDDALNLICSFCYDSFIKSIDENTKKDIMTYGFNKTKIENIFKILNYLMIVLHHTFGNNFKEVLTRECRYY